MARRLQAARHRSRSRSTAHWERGLSAGGTSGVQFAEVEVDIETGISSVKKIVCVQDCGLIVDLQDRREPVLRRHHQRRELRAVRGPHPRSQHRRRWSTRTWSGTCSPGMSDIPEIDVVLDRSAGARRHRHRRAADGADRRGDRQRGPQRHRRRRCAAFRSRRDKSQRAEQRARGRHECESLCLRQRRERERGGRRARRRSAASVLPMAGGMDLLALMKDYIVAARSPRQRQEASIATIAASRTAACGSARR